MNLIRHTWLIIFIFFILESCLYAQTTTVTIGDKKIKIVDNSYKLDYRIQKIFYDVNRGNILNLFDKIDSLPFDHCNHSVISFVLYLDTLPEIKHIEFVSNTFVSKSDSSLVNIIRNQIPWKPVVFAGRKEKVIALLSVSFSQIEGTHDRSDEAMYNINWGMTFTHPSKKGSVSCADNTYFYNEGVKYIEANDYKKALYNFKQALNYNAMDLNACFNLGIAYQKLDKADKACECFSKGVYYEDSNSIKAFNKYCPAPSKN